MLAKLPDIPRSPRGARARCDGVAARAGYLRRDPACTRQVLASAGVRNTADVDAGLTTDDAPSENAAVEGIVATGTGTDQATRRCRDTATTLSRLGAGLSTPLVPATTIPRQRAVGPRRARNEPERRRRSRRHRSGCNGRSRKPSGNSTTRERAAARHEVTHALNALDEARAKAGLPRR